MASVQMDDEDLFARTLVPALLKVPLEVREGETGEQDLLDFTEGARDLLRSWDYSTPASDSDASAAAAYYNAVWRNLCELTFDDELPADMKSDGGARWRAAVTRLLEDPDNAWWDNKLTPNITEGRDEILRQALVEARLELTTELGKDPQGWDWGKLHRLTLQHRVLGGDAVPGPVRWLFNEGPTTCRAARPSSTPTAGARARGTRSTGRRRCGWSSTSPTSTARRGSTRPA